MNARTAKMIETAKSYGRAHAKIHLAQIACKGVDYPICPPYSRESLVAAYWAGANEIILAAE